MTTPTEQARTQTIRESLDTATAAIGRGEQWEQARIPWRTAFYFSPVIDLPIASVVLNPRSHRIRAQLESHVEGEAIKADPYSETSQTIIAGLLRQTPDFEPLKNNLRDVKQREYGIVTHRGLLVNANTRCVALRDLEASYVRVAVLPDDAKQQEIDEIELQLQMEQEFRQPYSFSNELLFIEDLVTVYHYTDEKVAIRMNWASEGDGGASLKKASEQTQEYMRMLATVRELQHLSGKRLPLTWFDDGKRQAMLELDREVERLKRQDSEAARRLKNNRLLALLAGVGYRELREIDDRFLERYLAPSLEEQPAFQGLVSDLIAPPDTAATPSLKGLDVFDAASAQSGDTSTEVLVERFATSHGQDRIVFVAGGQGAVERDRPEAVTQMKLAVESAAEDAKIDGQTGNRLERPRKLVRQAAKNIRAAIEAYNQVSKRDDFPKTEFNQALADLSTATAALNRAASDS